ncbi:MULTISPECIES: HD domain-containing protein [unclassified Saccharopolyspora]|uniref:HD domain-containing protein n=1 Tax=Saccharopolyspora TaxID=1835 RepID=UPI0027DE5C8E|nr:HD domain-containing protein [Saccharopolyspora sp. HNM0986]
MGKVMVAVRVEGGVVLGLVEVEEVARKAHAGQVDKAGRPYAEHLAAVAAGVISAGGDDCQIAAAWLHDAVEDGAVSPEWLARADLSERTRSIVLALTRRDGEDQAEYARRILATPGALLVKRSDLAHNADPQRLAELDAATAGRLARKYAEMRELLGIGS